MISLMVASHGDGDHAVGDEAMAANDNQDQLRGLNTGDKPSTWLPPEEIRRASGDEKQDSTFICLQELHVCSFFFICFSGVNLSTKESCIYSFDRF